MELRNEKLPHTAIRKTSSRQLGLGSRLPQSVLNWWGETTSRGHGLAPFGKAYAQVLGGWGNARPTGSANALRAPEAA
jgi:hypothetical protein